MKKLSEQKRIELQGAGDEYFEGIKAKAKESMSKEAYEIICESMSRNKDKLKFGKRPDSFDPTITTFQKWRKYCKADLTSTFWF